MEQKENIFLSLFQAKRDFSSKYVWLQKHITWGNSLKNAFITNDDQSFTRYELPSVSHLRWKHNRIEYPLVSTSSTFSRQPTSLNYISIIYHGITTKCVKRFNSILSTALIITETEMYLKDLLSLDFKCSAKYTTDLKCQIIFLDNNHGIVNMTTKIQPQQHQQQQQKLQ